MTFHTLGMSSSQLTNSIIFQSGWLEPPTRDMQKKPLLQPVIQDPPCEYRIPWVKWVAAMMDQLG